jgi:hypothetical protein
MEYLSIFLTAAVMYIIVTESNGQCTKNGPLDVSLLLDTSDSMTAEYFENVLKPSVKLLLDLLYPGNEDSVMISRLSIIAVNEKPTIYWMDKENTQKKVWYAAIKNMSQTGGGRATGDAINQVFVAKEQLRPDVPQITILFLGGIQNAGFRNAVSQGGNIRAAGYKLYVVSMDNYRDNREFLKIAYHTDCTATVDEPAITNRTIEQFKMVSEWMCLGRVPDRKGIMRHSCVCKSCVPGLFNENARI